MVLTIAILLILVLVLSIALFIIDLYCDIKSLIFVEFLLQIFWLWKNRKWKNCRAKQRALEKYLERRC